MYLNNILMPISIDPGNESPNIEMSLIPCIYTCDSHFSPCGTPTEFSSSKNEYRKETTVVDFAIGVTTQGSLGYFPVFSGSTHNVKKFQPKEFIQLTEENLKDLKTKGYIERKLPYLPGYPYISIPVKSDEKEKEEIKKTVK